MSEQELILKDIQDVLKKYPGSYIKASGIDSFEIRISGTCEKDENDKVIITKLFSVAEYMFISDTDSETYTTTTTTTTSKQTTKNLQASTINWE